MSLYIRHEDLQTPENGVALFGPWSALEIEARVNDAQADMFAQTGNVDVVELTDEEASKLTINSRAWWLEQLAVHS